MNPFTTRVNGYIVCTIGDAWHEVLCPSPVIQPDCTLTFAGGPIGQVMSQELAPQGEHKAGRGLWVSVAAGLVHFDADIPRIR